MPGAGAIGRTLKQISVPNVQRQAPQERATYVRGTYTGAKMCTWIIHTILTYLKMLMAVRV